MLPVDIILGYLSIPVIVGKSVYAQSSKFDQPIWSYGNLPIAFFVSDPPAQWDTLSKHTLRLKPTATPGDKELFQLLYSSLQPPQAHRKDNKACYGIIIFDSSSSLYTNTSSTSLDAQKFLGIVSCTQQNELNLQVIQSPLSHVNSTNTSTIDQYPLDTETWSTYPLEVLRLCQSYTTNPASQAQLRSLVIKVNHIASLYGYWELWQVVEGICDRFGIHSRTFLP